MSTIKTDRIEPLGTAINISGVQFFTSGNVVLGGLTATNAVFGGLTATNAVLGGLTATNAVLGGLTATNNVVIQGSTTLLGGVSLSNFALSNVFTIPTGTSNYGSGLGNGVNNTVYAIGQVIAIYPGTNVAVTLPTTGTWFYYVHATGNLSGTSNTSELPYVGVAAGGTVVTPTPNSLHGNASTWAGFAIRLY